MSHAIVWGGKGLLLCSHRQRFVWSHLSEFWCLHASADSSLLVLLTHSASARKYPKRAEPVAFWENEDRRLSPYCLIPQIHWSRKQLNTWSNVLILSNSTGNRRIILHEVAADGSAFIRPSLVLSVGYIRAEYGSLAESQHVPIQTL